MFAKKYINLFQERYVIQWFNTKINFENIDLNKPQQGEENIIRIKLNSGKTVDWI